MRRNYFDPSTARVLQRMPTVTPLRIKVMAYLRCVLWLLIGVLAVFGVVGLIAIMHATDDKLDRVFMQGMQAGHQMCPRGAGA